MSDTSQIPSILNDASSMLYDAFDMVSGFFTFIGFIALYILGLLIGAVVAFAIAEIMGNDPSGERACGLAVANAVLFTVSILVGLDKYFPNKGY